MSGKRWSHCWTEPGVLPADCSGRPGTRQQGIRIDRRAFPPALLRAEQENREMQVWRTVGGIAGTAHIADHLALLHLVALLQPGGIAVQVGVVVRVAAGRVELVD